MSFIFELELKLGFNETCVANNGVGQCQDFANLSCGPTGYCRCSSNSLAYNSFYKACRKYLKFLLTFYSFLIKILS